MHHIEKDITANMWYKLEGNDNAISRHLNAFETQINHESFKFVSANYRRLTIGYIRDYISEINDPKIKREQERRFKSLLGDD